MLSCLYPALPGEPSTAASEATARGRAPGTASPQCRSKRRTAPPTPAADSPPAPSTARHAHAAPCATAAPRRAARTPAAAHPARTRARARMTPAWVTATVAPALAAARRQPAPHALEQREQRLAAVGRRGGVLHPRRDGGRIVGVQARPACARARRRSRTRRAPGRSSRPGRAPRRSGARGAPGWSTRRRSGPAEGRARGPPRAHARRAARRSGTPNGGSRQTERGG